MAVALSLLAGGATADARVQSGYAVYVEASLSYCYDSWNAIDRFSSDGSAQGTDQSDDFGWPVVSGDGATLAYAHRSAVWALKLGAPSAQPHKAAALRGRRAKRPLYPLAISPDGRTLLVDAFYMRNSRYVNTYYVFRGGRRIRTLALPENLSIASARWSPTGSIAVTYVQRSETERLGILDLHGRLRKLHVTVDGGIAWSPGGWSIAYGYRGSVFTVQPDGRGRQRLIRHAYAPAWSPDGTHLAFIRGSYGDWRLWVADAYGRHQRRVTAVSSDDRPGSTAWGLRAARLPGQVPLARASDC